MSEKKDWEEQFEEKFLNNVSWDNFQLMNFQNEYPERYKLAMKDIKQFIRQQIKQAKREAVEKANKRAWNEINTRIQDMARDFPSEGIGQIVCSKVIKVVTTYYLKQLEEEE